VGALIMLAQATTTSATAQESLSVDDVFATVKKLEESSEPISADFVLRVSRSGGEMNVIGQIKNRGALMCSNLNLVIREAGITVEMKLLVVADEDGITWTEMRMGDEIVMVTKESTEQLVSALFTASVKIESAVILGNPFQLVQDLNDQFDLTMKTEVIDGLAVYVLEGPVRDKFRREVEEELLSKSSPLTSHDLKEEGFPFERARLKIAQDGAYPHELTFLNSKDAPFLEVSFANLQVGRAFDGAAFAYTPPGGVPVTDLTNVSPPPAWLRTAPPDEPPDFSELQRELTEIKKAKLTVLARIERIQNFLGSYEEISGSSYAHLFSQVLQDLANLYMIDQQPKKATEYAERSYLYDDSIQGFSSYFANLMMALALANNGEQLAKAEAIALEAIETRERSKQLLPDLVTSSPIFRGIGLRRDALAHVVLGLVAWKRENPEAAETNLRAAGKIDAWKTPLVAFKLGEYLLREGKTDAKRAEGMKYLAVASTSRYHDSQDLSRHWARLARTRLEVEYEARNGSLDGIEELVVAANKEIRLRRQRITNPTASPQVIIPSEPPGPAPPGKVWSKEHGHWHDLTPKSGPTSIPGEPPSPAPPGKVWSKEHGHWHDLAPGDGDGQ
jgi:hypothetical protein